MTREEHATRASILTKLEQRMQHRARDLESLSDEDLERLAFLTRLDGAEFDVTDWEAGFIESFLSNPRPMTTAQRGAVDGMREQYEEKM